MDDRADARPADGHGWARTAWMAVALLWPVALLNYLDRQMLASMKFSVMADVADIGTDANWGLMLGQFKWM
ncbi:MAG: MFS transporter, partial [Phycisphaerales bacterium]